MSLAAVRFLLVGVLCVSCASCTFGSNEQTPEYAEKREAKIQQLKEQIRDKERYAVRLVCLKNEITSDALIEELLAIVLRTNIVYNLNEMKDEGKAPRTISDAILSSIYAPTDDQELKSLAKKYNVPVSKLASVIYDYEIWTNSENCRE